MPLFSPFYLVLSLPNTFIPPIPPQSGSRRLRAYVFPIAMRPQQHYLARPRQLKLEHDNNTHPEGCDNALSGVVRVIFIAPTGYASGEFAGTM